MVADAKDPNLSELDLAHVPRGPETFELAAKFCYGMNFEITTTNLARLHCVAEYLEMTEDYREEILIVRTETFLVEFVSPKLEKSVEVLSSCEALLPTAEEVYLVCSPEDDSQPNVLRGTTIGTGLLFFLVLVCCLYVFQAVLIISLVVGPPESVVDWTKKSESDLGNPKYRRLLYCQNGQSNS